MAGKDIPNEMIKGKKSVLLSDQMYTTKQAKKQGIRFLEFLIVRHEISERKRERFPIILCIGPLIQFLWNKDMPPSDSQFCEPDIWVKASAVTKRYSQPAFPPDLWLQQLWRTHGEQKSCFWGENNIIKGVSGFNFSDRPAKPTLQSLIREVVGLRGLMCIITLHSAAHLQCSQSQSSACVVPSHAYEACPQACSWAEG